MHSSLFRCPSAPLLFGLCAPRISASAKQIRFPRVHRQLLCSSAPPLATGTATSTPPTIPNLDTQMTEASEHTSKGWYETLGDDERLRVRAGRKLRILCLHGYQQSAEIFSSRMGSVRKAMKSRAEFIFVDAPVIADPEPVVVDLNDTSDRGIGRTWWTWQDENLLRPSRARQITGWEDSLATITNAIKENAPIDGIFGFSQGATGIAILLAEPKMPKELADLRFAIIVSGFMPYDESMSGMIIEAESSVPTLFVWGASDEMVPSERSKQLAAAFDPAAIQTYEHAGAHMVPSCSGEFKDTLAAFLDKFAN